MATVKSISNQRLHFGFLILSANDFAFLERRRSAWTTKADNTHLQTVDWRVVPNSHAQPPLSITDPPEPVASTPPPPPPFPPTPEPPTPHGGFAQGSTHVNVEKSVLGMHV
jgi:hypothetical protein